MDFGTGHLTHCQEALQIEFDSSWTPKGDFGRDEKNREGKGGRKEKEERREGRK